MDLAELKADLVDAEASVRALRLKLEEAYSAEQAAAVARLLARRALDEAIERCNAARTALHTAVAPTKRAAKFKVGEAVTSWFEPTVRWTVADVFTSAKRTTYRLLRPTYSSNGMLETVAYEIDLSKAQS